MAYGVVRVERDTVQRLTVLVKVLLDINAIRIIRPDFVESQDMQHHQHEQNHGNSHNMQRKEAIQGNTGHIEIAPHPDRQVFADHRDSTGQRNNHLRTPVGHVAPRQQVAKKALSHQRQIDEHAEHPDQFTGLLV